jgi:hypothetical protein
MSCSSAGFLPALVTLVGELDADHEVFVISYCGQMEIRFHHADHSPADQTHGNNAILDEPGMASREDHIVQFASPGHLLLQASDGFVSSDSPSWIADMEAASGNLSFQRHAAISRARPPPRNTALLRCLHSVVLLV